MLKEELVELVERIYRQKCEEQTVELKCAKHDCPKRLYDTLSGFSNQDNGGIIVFGIDEDDDYKVAGVYDAQELQKKVTEQCQQMIPPVRAVFTIAEIEEKTVCCAEIPPLDISERPCYYAGAGKTKGAYIRVGDADLPMTDYELYSFEAFRKHLHDDERCVEKCPLDMLDMGLVGDYINKRSEERPAFSKLSFEQVCQMLNITADGSVTMSALMNFGIYPQAYFPQLGITAISVQGYEIGDLSSSNERFIDNRRIEGTIKSMLEDSLLFCKKNMRLKTVIDKTTGKREDVSEYPVEALRECIVNALIHRDYSFHTEGTPIQIVFFTDRVEIHSPGNLYGRMSIEMLGKAKPDLRNPALAVMAESLNLTENRYSGVPTIRRAMKEYNLPEPVFENRRNEFVVTLYNSNNRQNDRADCARTLEEFCTEPRTRKEISDYLGLDTSSYAMSYYVQPLLNEGKLAMTIPDKPKSKNQKYYYCGFKD